MRKIIKKVFLLIATFAMAFAIVGCKKEEVNPIKGHTYSAVLANNSVLKVRFAEKVIDLYLDDTHIEETDVYEVNFEKKIVSFRKGDQKISLIYAEDGSQISGNIDGESVTLKRNN